VESHFSQRKREVEHPAALRISHQLLPLRRSTASGTYNQPIVNDTDPLSNATQGPGPEPARTLEVRFFLSERELKEAFATLHPLITDRRFKTVARVLNGLAAVFYLSLPHLVGQSWKRFLQTQPVEAVLLVAAALVSGWSATGSIGSKTIDRFLNRVDLERHVVLADRGVTIARGDRTREYEWRRFMFFRETADLFILQTTGTSFWTIPKRVFDRQGEQDFRAFLGRKLHERQSFLFRSRSAPTTS
jgi:YcxB-like protein